VKSLIFSSSCPIASCPVAVKTLTFIIPSFAIGCLPRTSPAAYDYAIVLCTAMRPRPAQSVRIAAVDAAEDALIEMVSRDHIPDAIRVENRSCHAGYMLEDDPLWHSASRPTTARSAAPPAA
jgi:hypothetical protein